MKNFYFLILSLCCVYSFPTKAQWSSNPDEDKMWLPIDTYTYENEALTDSDGNTWYFYQHPLESSIVEYRVQLLDKDGVAKFSDPKGMLISSYKSPYTVINQHTMLDSENNLIVVVHDARHSTDEAGNMTYTAYKISPEGRMLWDEDGVPLNPTIVSELSGALTMTELDDKSIVFAWMRYIGDIPCIDMQRVTSDGVAQWDAAEMSIQEPSTPYSYPYVVNAGSNQFIMVFAKGASSDLYARKIDFDGTEIWEKDTRIYRGGWSLVPLWTKIDVKPSGDGGVVVAWTDDRTTEGFELPYLSYVKANGTLGFSAASATGDVRLDWEDAHQGYNIKVMPAADGNSFYVYWLKTDKLQIWNNLVIQRVSKSGELIWGETAMPLTDIIDTKLGYFTILPADEGNLAAFYMHRHSYYDVTTHINLIDAELGTLIPDKSLMFTAGKRSRDSLMPTVCESEKFWIASWCDLGEADGDLTSYRCKRINFDLTYGSDHISGIDEIESSTDCSTFAYFKGNFHVSLTAPSVVQIKVYDMSGKLVASQCQKSDAGNTAISCPTLPAGVYIARFETGSQCAFIKFSAK